MKLVSRFAARLPRVASLVLLAALGTIALMRFAPGYFTDAREMDAAYSGTARASLDIQREQQRSVLSLAGYFLKNWLHGDLGRSRQFDVPVTELIHPRLPVTARLLLTGLASGWLLAFAAALLLSARRGSSGDLLVTIITALLLAIPVGAMATLSLLTSIGGPASVLASIVAVRDFKLFYRLLRHTWNAPHLLHARAQGLATSRIAIVHLIPSLTTELFALASTSLVLALSAIVPVEVVFNVPGLGQLAWAAAMNRDLPVLLAVTLLIALSIGIAGAFAEPAHQVETA